MLRGLPRKGMRSTQDLSLKRLKSRSLMRSRSSTAVYPAACSAVTIAPAEAPATFWVWKPCSSSTERAPTKALPFTPPPSSTRSTRFSCSEIGHDSSGRGPGNVLGLETMFFQHREGSYQGVAFHPAAFEHQIDALLLLRDRSR